MLALVWLTVAQKDKEESLNLWCHLWTEKNGDQSSRLLVIHNC